MKQLVVQRSEVRRRYSERKPLTSKIHFLTNNLRFGA